MYTQVPTELYQNQFGHLTHGLQPVRGVPNSTFQSNLNGTGSGFYGAQKHYVNSGPNTIPQNVSPY